MATARKLLIRLKRVLRLGLTRTDIAGTPLVLLGQGDYRRAYTLDIGDRND